VSYSATLSGHVALGNAAYERHFEIRVADVPRDYSILADPQLEAAGLLPLVRRAYAGETVQLPPVRYDAARVTSSSGRTVWTQGHCFPVRDAAGAVTHVAIVHVDVTQWAEAEAAIRELNAELTAGNAQLQDQGLELELSNQQLQDQASELEAQAEELRDAAAELEERSEEADRARDAAEESERRFRTNANAAPVLIWTAGTDALCDWFNQVWLDFTGRTMAEETGNGWGEGVHPDDLQHCLDIYLSNFHARRAFEMEYRLRRHDGEYRWLLDHGVPRFDADGEFVGFIGSCVDVTERKLAEATLAESERQWRTMADAIPTLAWTARADGYIDWYNARWYEYTGTAPEQMAGWGWQSVHDAALLPSVLERWQASIATGERFEMTFPLRGADGRFRPFLTRVTPVTDAEGRVVRWFGTNTDVEAERAARDAAESAVARTERLQALTAALARARTLDDVAVVVVDEAVAATSAKSGALIVRPRGHDEAVIVRQTGLPNDVVTRYQRVPRRAPGPTAACLRTGEPAWVESLYGPEGLVARYAERADSA